MWNRVWVLMKVHTTPYWSVVRMLGDLSPQPRHISPSYNHCSQPCMPWDYDLGPRCLGLSLIGTEGFGPPKANQQVCNILPHHACASKLPGHVLTGPELSEHVQG